MFLQVSVCSQGGGSPSRGVLHLGGFSIWGGSPSGGVLHPGGFSIQEGGFSIQEGGFSIQGGSPSGGFSIRGGLGGSPSGQCAGGTHPTGMHSC